MFEFNHSTFGEVVILGHVVSFSGALLDMRDNSWLERIKSNFTESWDTGQESQSIKPYFEMILDSIALESGWGNAENAYEFALQSSDYVLRSMVALNGKHPDILSKDENEHVRACAVKGAGMLEKALGMDVDNKWLDDMVSDDSLAVRVALCAHEEAKHLDVLINDLSPLVREMVATYTDNKEHLRKLACDQNDSVRMAVVENKAFSEFHLLENDVHEEIQSEAIRYELRREEELAMTVDAADAGELLASKRPQIREMLAMRGIGLETLVNDSSYKVRMAVAREGYGLDILMDDKSLMVAAAAIAYPAMLIMPS